MGNNRPHTLKDQARVDALPRGSEPSARIMELVQAHARGLLTWSELVWLTSQTEPECTCTPDLPDGRSGYVCETCRAEAALREIEF